MAKTAKTVTLSVKNVPAELAKRLKERAKVNHRSLQGELMAILQYAVSEKRAEGYMTFDDIAELAKRLGIKSERNESTQWIREDRDDPRR